MEETTYTLFFTMVKAIVLGGKVVILFQVLFYILSGTLLT